MRRWTKVLGAASLVCALAALSGGAVSGQPVTSRALPAPAAVAANDQVQRGRYLAVLGDCMACHTVKGKAAFSGGRPLQTPFGTVLSANLTPDETGIGSWDADDFYKALHEGVAKGGVHLYPAFPYPYYTKMSRADSDALFAYLRTVPAVKNDPKRDQLPFPFNIRFLMVFWNWLFFDKGEFQTSPDKSAQWNRGAYLVNGPAHCGACHTPRNFMGGPKKDKFLQGGTFADWFAPDLSGNPRTGLGGWTADELKTFLSTGRNAHALAAGEMGEVAAFSTSRMEAADIEAIVTYLKAQPASPDATPGDPNETVMAEGEAIFVDECSACHRMAGEGVPAFFPPLKGSAGVQQTDPTTVVRFILAGVQATPTDKAPTGLTMPPFAWKLSDSQVAAVATYVRNSWGNKAAPVQPSKVAGLRRKLIPDDGLRPEPVDHATASPSPTSYMGAENDDRTDVTKSK